MALEAIPHDLIYCKENFVQLTWYSFWLTKEWTPHQFELHWEHNHYVKKIGISFSYQTYPIKQAVLSVLLVQVLDVDNGKAVIVRKPAFLPVARAMPNGF